jgi:hypothetical protein
MTDLYHDKAPPKSGEGKEQKGDWKEKNSAEAAPPAGEAKGDAKPGQPPEQPAGAGKGAATGATAAQGDKKATPESHTAEGKSVKEMQEEAAKKGKKPEGKDALPGAAKAEEKPRDSQPQEDKAIKIHADVETGGEEHELDNQPGTYLLILSSTPIFLDKHPNAKVRKAYAAYLQAISAATSPTGKKEAANRNLKLIVGEIKAAGTADAPGASAPGIGTINLHKNQQSKLRRSGIEVWQLESEHVIPRAFVDTAFRALVQAGIPAGKADYNNMHTILIYKGATDKKTEGAEADQSKINEFKTTIIEIRKHVFATRDKDRGKAYGEMSDAIFRLLSAFAADAEGRTNDAIADENREQGAKRGPAGSPEPPTPTASQVATAFDRQRDDINAQLAERISDFLADRESASD